MHRLERPTLASRSSYARRFQDPVFWQPYLDEVLRRHGLPPRQAILGTGGTFPTFLVGEYVVKVFSRRFDGAECFLTERALHSQVLPRLRQPTPRHVADGHLFETGWRWPYIVTTRLAGTSWREASRRPGEWQRVVAAELGAALREVPCPGLPRRTGLAPGCPASFLCCPPSQPAHTAGVPPRSDRRLSGATFP